MDQKVPEQYLQCQQCGYVFKMEIKGVEKETSGFIIGQCPRCKGTDMLRIGETPDDVYLYYNVNVDPRYY